MNLQQIIEKSRVASPAVARPALGQLPVTRPMLRPALVRNEESPGVISDALKGFYNMLSGGGSTEIPRIDAITALDQLTKSFDDTKTVQGRIVSSSPEMQVLNQTAYSFAYEPDLMDRQLSNHVPYDVDVNPVTIVFDENGIGSVGADSFTSVGLTTDMLLSTGVSVLGWLFVVQGLNTLVGTAQIGVSSNLNVKYNARLKDVQSTGAFVIMNHASDTSASIRTVPGGVTAGKAEFTIQQVNQSVANQFYQSFTNDLKLDITGINITVDVYPIFNQRSISALGKALVYSDQLPLFADYVRIAALATVG